jgi:hypothetical protein
MQKVKPVLNSFTTKFRNVHMPEENLTTDKAICAY